MIVQRVEYGGADEVILTILQARIPPFANSCPRASRVVVAFRRTSSATASMEAAATVLATSNTSVRPSAACGSPPGRAGSGAIQTHPMRALERGEGGEGGEGQRLLVAHGCHAFLCRWLVH
jgi:hypothetical protein